MLPKRFTEIFDQSTTGFFRDNCQAQATVTHVPELKLASTDSIIATVGFSCDIAKGVLLVVGQANSLRASHPMVAMGAAVSESDLCDWAGEIANQTLGRYKNALLPYGIVLNMSVPTVIKGNEMRLANQFRGERYLCNVRMGSELVLGFGIDIEFARGFDVSVIDRIEPEANSARKEGDGFLF